MNATRPNAYTANFCIPNNKMNHNSIIELVQFYEDGVQ